MNRLANKLSVLLLMVSLIQCKDDCEKIDNCYLEPDPGPCFAAFTKYYFDKVEKKCKPFTWGGCGGVVPFDTLDECKSGCLCGFKP